MPIPFILHCVDEMLIFKVKHLYDWFYSPGCLLWTGGHLRLLEKPPERLVHKLSEKKKFKTKQRIRAIPAPSPSLTSAVIHDSFNSC